MHQMWAFGTQLDFVSAPDRHCKALFVFPAPSSHVRANGCNAWPHRDRAGLREAVGTAPVLLGPQGPAQLRVLYKESGRALRSLCYNPSVMAGTPMSPGTAHSHGRIYYPPVLSGESEICN